VENSLRRLGTDWIDLYQIHRYDPGTDLDETLGALTDLVRAGKVRYIGHSTWPVSAIVAAQWTASDRDRERFASEQPPYSVLTRAIESDVLPTCARYGMGVIPYSPLAGGWLSGRYRTGSAAAGPTSPARQRLANRFDLSLPENQRKLEATEQLADLPSTRPTTAGSAPRCSPRPGAASRLSTGRAGDGVLQVSLRPPQAAERRSSSPAALTDRHPR
jgi:aryl-alcohol dehydrogenase-like predicted oxidoreductase